MGAGLMTLAAGCVSEKAKHEDVLRQRVKLRGELSLYAIAPGFREPPKALVRDFASICLCGRKEAFHEVAYSIPFIMKEFVDSASVSQVQGEFDTVVMNKLAFLASYFECNKIEYSPKPDHSPLPNAAVAQLLRILKSPRLKDAPLTQERGRTALKAVLKDNPQLIGSTEITSFLTNPITDSSDEVPLFCCDTGQIKFREEKPSRGSGYEYETPGYVRQPGKIEKLIDALRYELGL
jgi:hypothetical protein